MMDRYFISCDNACRGGCLYCFSKWKEYKKFEHESKPRDNTIIYPNCDGNMFDNNFRITIEQFSKLQKKYSLSISTKFDISGEDLIFVKRIHEELCRSSKGIVKLSISFSCSNSLEMMEPQTADYDKRIQLVKRISEIGVPYTTIIKPILPFIDIEEYYRIIDDTIRYSPYYLIGDLYVSDKTYFYEKYIKDKWCTELRNVEWNGENGPWQVVVDNQKRKEIADYIVLNGGKVFESDEKVMEYLITIYGQNIII